MLAGPVQILVLDDDEPVLELMRELLQAEGYTVTVAQALDAGVELARSLRPDLIILDLYFAGKPAGRRVLEQLRSDPATATTPVIVCSAGTVPDHEQARLLSFAPAQYVQKPFDLGALVGLVATLLTTPQTA